MPGQYSRLKVWSSGEILTASDLNAEFNNEITNAIPSSIDDYSSNATQMQTSTDPGEVGTESLPTSLSGELERIRFVLKELKGTAQWYSTAATDIATLSSTESTLHVGLEFDGKLAGASSTTDVLAKFVNQGGIINASSLTTADVVAADFDATNIKFGTHSYILAAGNILAIPGTNGNPVKGTLSAWFRNLSSSDYIAYNPLLGLELFLSAAGFLTFKSTERTTASETAKNTNSVVGVASRAGDTTFRNVIAQWKFNDEGGASTDLQQLKFGSTPEGTQITGDNIDINGGDGGIWFFGSKRQDPTWAKFSAFQVLPSSEAADAWTANGTTAGNSVSGGILTIDDLAGGNVNDFYSKTNNIDLAAMTIEFKMKVNTSVREALIDSRLRVECRDDSLNRSMVIRFAETGLTLSIGSANRPVFEAWYNTKSYHVYRITSSGSPSPTIKIYIDGVLVYTGTNAEADATVNDTISFGDASGPQNSSSDWEWFSYIGTAATAPIAASASGNLDSIGVSSSILSDITVTALQSSAITAVLKKQQVLGPTLPYQMSAERDSAFAISTTSTTLADMGSLVYYIAGDGVTEYLFSVDVGAAHTVAGTSGDFIIDVDNDVNGLANSTGRQAENGVTLNFPTANDSIPIHFARSVILSAGLHEIRPNFATGAATLNLSENNQRFDRAIISTKML